MWAPSRRTFLATSSLTLAGVTTGLSRSTLALPSRARRSVSTFVPDFITADALRALAVGGVEAARAAGATYADIRIADLHTLELAQGGPPKPACNLAFELGYGIRVQVDGAWAFAYGAHLTTDSIARSARTAVSTARGLAKVAPRRRELVPAPVVTGEWRTPVAIDPFSVSPDEHARMVGALKDAATRLLDGNVAQCIVQWDAETRVFASSEGSLITQHLKRFRPTIFVDYPQEPAGQTSLPIPDMMPRSAGFECLLGPELQEKIKATVEETARISRVPTAVAELGRRPAVFDGTAVGSMLGGTLVQALNLSRALGHEADGAGTSFLSPVNEVLGKPLFSPLLNVTADRAMPHYGAAQWDDEGVPTEAFPLIQQGRVVDYFATRVTTPALADWYAKRGMPLKSHGAAVSWKPSLAPDGCPLNLTMSPEKTGPSLDTLVKQLSNGLLVRGVAGFGLGYGGVSADPQLSGGLFFPMMMYEIKKGQITRRLMNGYLQFSTQKFWNGIAALGGTSSVEHFMRSVRLRPSGVQTTLPIAAPAAQFQQIDVVPPRRF